MTRIHTGFESAFHDALNAVEPIDAETVPISDAVGRIASEPAHAVVDSPSVDASFKDGYAVISADVTAAAADNPVKLRIIGTVGAGERPALTIEPGACVRVLSGARIPDGADAVLAEEFAYLNGDTIEAFADAHPGRNILFRGTDTARGDTLVERGRSITPGALSRLAAGGVTELKVFRRLRIGLLASGDEVLLPGRRLSEGQVYASNLVLQDARLRSLGMDTVMRRVGDNADELAPAVLDLNEETDALLTSGGAWSGDRDLVVRVLESVGWRKLFHRVRIGPGKAVGLGALNGKPIFCLPGGPPSNETAFLMIALPALMKMAGAAHSPFLRLTGRLTDAITGQIDWTQFIRCRIRRSEHEILLDPLPMVRRLESMAAAEALVKIPEGIDRIDAGSPTDFFCLDETALMTSHDGPLNG